MCSRQAVYGNQFNWIIKRLNQTLHKPIDNPKIVGVLDIFGFEIFETNRFEQLCINFANEKMQQHFNEHIFTMEQNEYKSDKIDVAHVEFIDNQPCLDMIEKGRNSILGCCDDELKLPKGSDLHLLERLNDAYGKGKYYTASKKREPIFTIIHYAGGVTYNIEGFMQKNQDKLTPDLAAVIAESKSAYVKELAPDPASKTLGHQFKTQLGQLMVALHSTQPNFIRCIKSNNQKVSDTLDAPMVLRQLRYLGLKEVVNIRQLGYPIRRTHADFNNRYLMLAPDAKVEGDDKATATAVLTQVTGIDEKDWRVGDTKAFYRNPVQQALEMARELYLSILITEIQNLGRAMVLCSR
jgi:myosin heavy subunit